MSGEAGSLTVDEWRALLGVLREVEKTGIRTGTWEQGKVRRAAERIVAAREAAAEQRGRDAVLADVESLKDEWARAADDLAPDDDWGDSVEDTLRADFFREKGRHLRDLIAKHRPETMTDHRGDSLDDDGSDR